MNVGDVRFNLYQPQTRASGPTAATGRGGYTTENVEAVEAVSPVRSTTSGANAPQQAEAPNTARSNLLASSGDQTRGQVIDILV